MVRILQLLVVFIVAVPAALAGRTPIEPPGDLLLRRPTATIAPTPLGTTHGYDAPAPQYSCPSQLHERAARHDFCNYDVFRRCFPEQFTAKLRDYESGLNLDYFGARYYAGAMGRFTTPDEFQGGIVDPFTGKQVSQPGPLPYADITDPQTLNRYACVRNNPLRYTDPDGLDWSDLSEEQRRVFQQYANNYNSANKTKLSTEQVYNTLNDSQMATYESVTYALEHTQLVDNQGNSMGNALQQVAGVSKIAGEIPGSSKGDEQFRVFANLKPGAIEAFGKAQGFEPSSNKVTGLFQVYHQGFPDSFRQIRRQGVTGMEAGVQPSYNRSRMRSDIDVDYRFGAAHLQPANSDVRAPGNYQRFIDRWPGLRNWWDK